MVQLTQLKQDVNSFWLFGWRMIRRWPAVNEPEMSEILWFNVDEKI